MKLIDIVIATFNGELYVAEQLDSIIACNEFVKLINKIIVSDDCSTDKTLEILKEYSRVYKNIYVTINKGQHGVAGNFENALNVTEANYVILCDQDDVWNPHKLEVLYEGITKIENGDDNIPCVFFSDLEIVDDKLNVIHKSYFEMIDIKPERFFNKNTVLLMNVVPGCSMIVNRRLIEIALPIKQNQIYIHDWWLLLIAFFGGSVGYSKESTFKYRQHDYNVFGTKKRGIIEKSTDSLKEFFKKDKFYSVAEDVHQRLVQHKIHAKTPIIKQFLETKNNSRLDQLRFMFQNKFYYHSVLRNIKLVLLVLFKRNL